jgi:hypothetical protein
LLNVKGLSYQEGFTIIKEWLDQCNQLKRLDFYPNSKIKEGLNGAAKGYFPISFEVLKQSNNELYHHLSVMK